MCASPIKRLHKSQSTLKSANVPHTTLASIVPPQITVTEPPLSTYPLATHTAANNGLMPLRSQFTIFLYSFVKTHSFLLSHTIHSWVGERVVHPPNAESKLYVPPACLASLSGIWNLIVIGDQHYVLLWIHDSASLWTYISAQGLRHDSAFMTILALQF